MQYQEVGMAIGGGQSQRRQKINYYNRPIAVGHNIQ